MSSTYTKNPNNGKKISEQTQDPSYYELELRVGKDTPNGRTVDKVQGDSPEDIPDVKVSDIIGDFGIYQISVIIFAALRALSCALDGLSGPFLAPNVKHFQCNSCDTTSPAALNSTGVCSVYAGDQAATRFDLDPGQCFFYNSDSIDRINCDKWSYDYPENDRFMHSLTVEQNLVCDREWLKSLSNSMYFVGATLGLLFWGIISDKYGRKTAYVCSHFVTLIFGFSALFANSMGTYILLRAINSFGMIGELIPRSIQLEIVATEYRFICSVICQIGWATGIILVPALSYINPDYRFILAVPVGLSFVMLPWLYYLPESARWLIASKQYAHAREELRHAAKINGKLTDDIDLKIERYNKQVLREEANSTGDHKRLGLMRSIMAIFTNLYLLKDTISVFILLFIAEVVYFSLTLNVADLGGSLYVNYIISGVSELVSIACCGTLLAYLSRRMCLSLLLLASTVSYLLLSLVNIYEEYLSMTVILGVNAFGKLTAIGNLMVIILVSQEIFPTVIRQFGTSLCITIGKAGSAVAPFTHELGQIIGQSWCFAMFSLLCLSCAIIPFIMSETGDKELADTVIDIGDDVDKGHKKRRKSANASSIKQNKVQNDLNGTTVDLKHEQDLNNNNVNDIQRSNGLQVYNNNSMKQQEIEDYMNNNDSTNSGPNNVPVEGATNPNCDGNDNKNNQHHDSENRDSRWPEFLALAAKNNCKFDLISSKDHITTGPFILIELNHSSNEESLIKSARESYLLKDLYELWAQSNVSVEDLAINASKSRHFEMCKARYASKPNQSFKIECESFGAKISQSMKVEMISKMFFTQSFEQSCFDLGNPTHTYCIFQMNHNDTSGRTLARDYYFGRRLVRSSRGLVDKFSLKKRNFIANTSMDPLLSLLAANAAQVKPNDIVFDPFVGSGSLLVAAASMGAYVLGSDIDWMLLHGKSKPSRKGMTNRADGECVRANLKQYNLESRYVDVIVSDLSRHAFDRKFELDSIITDPPYGIRESSERIGHRLHERHLKPNDTKLRFPSKISYQTTDLITDLLNFSVDHLRVAGRLVYYLPVTLEDSGDKFEDFLPSHPCLELVSFSDQQLTRKTYRLMVTMEKVKQLTEPGNKVNLPAALLSMDFRRNYFNEKKN